MSALAIDSIGFCAAAISCSIALPQLIKILKNKDVTGVSAGSWWLTLANATLWLVWAVMAQAWAAGIPSLVNAPMAIVILLLIAKGNTSSEAAVTLTETAPATA